MYKYLYIRYKNWRIFSYEPAQTAICPESRHNTFNMLVRLLLTTVFFSVVYTEDIVNLINPLWKLPVGVNDGANIASEMAASVVGVVRL